MRLLQRRSDPPIESEVEADLPQRQPVSPPARGVWFGLSRWHLGLLSMAFCVGVAGMVLHPQPSAPLGQARTVGNPSALLSGADSMSSLELGETAETRRTLATEAGSAQRGDFNVDEQGGDDSSLLLQERLGDLSPLLTKLGFSFVVGFAVGYVLLFFLRAAALLAGLVLAALFGLQYAGVVQVDWPGIETNYESALGWLLPRFDALRTFLLENLSSSGSAALGLLSGLMRR